MLDTDPYLNQSGSTILVECVQELGLSQAALWDASSDTSLSSTYTTSTGTILRLYVHFARMLDREED
jgi:hypothetical protein